MEHTLILKFKVSGNLKYLSHHQSMAMFIRALIRSGTGLCYSEGFNPRPKLSLPLPRGVGIESDDELLYASVKIEETAEVKERISNELPEGVEIESLRFVSGKTRVQPVAAVYELKMVKQPDELISNINRLQEALAAKEEIVVNRRYGQSGKTVEKEIGCYIDSIEYASKAVQVKCRISPAGSVRLDEILRLIGMDTSECSVSVKRKSTEWVYN